MGVSSPELELYHLQGCPYCKQVTQALSDLGLEYKTHSVAHSRSNRPEVEEVSGQRGVPVLVDRTNGIEGMAESDDIIEYLYDEYGDGKQPPPSGIINRLLHRLF